MKIAVTTVGNNMDAAVDPRFGRAQNFLVYDTESEETTVYPNEQNLQAAQGAGVQAGQNILQTGAEILISGNIGPKAFTVLQQGGVKVYTCTSGTVKEVIADYQAGKLVETRGATKPGHWM